MHHHRNGVSFGLQILLGHLKLKPCHNQEQQDLSKEPKTMAFVWSQQHLPSYGHCCTREKNLLSKFHVAAFGDCILYHMALINKSCRNGQIVLIGLVTLSGLWVPKPGLCNRKTHLQTRFYPLTVSPLSSRACLPKLS